MAVDEIEEQPKHIEYSKLLKRLMSTKETEHRVNRGERTDGQADHDSTIGRTAVLPPWCYHEDDP
jgi:hypothetical protein